VANSRCWKIAAKKVSEGYLPMLDSGPSLRPQFDFKTIEVTPVSRSLLALGSLLTIATVMCTVSTGAQNNSDGTSQHLVPVQRQTGPKRKPQISAVPNADPNGSTVRQRYPQPPGSPPVTDACFITVRPPQGCMYTPYVFYAGTACDCVDSAGNVYQGEFLLY